jgi:hypothetical protein
VLVLGGAQQHRGDRRVEADDGRQEEHDDAVHAPILACF